MCVGACTSLGHRRILENCTMSENFESLFGAPPPHPIDVEAHLDGLFFFIDGHDIEKIVYKTQYEFGCLALNTAAANFGAPATSLAGDRVWFRVDSFKDNAMLSDRAMSSMVVGEIRQFVIVVGSAARPLAEGVCTVIRAYKLQFDRTKLLESAKPIPVMKETVSFSSYGASLVPMVYCDRHRKRSKKSEILIHNYPVTVFGSMDVFSINGSVRSMSIKRSFSSFALSEWICEASQPSLYDASSPYLQRISEDAYDFQLKKCISKITTTFQRRNEKHPEEGNLIYPQTVTSVGQAFKLASFYSSLSTVGAFVDILASGTCAGIPLPILEDPMNIPLFIAMCITLAAKPILEFPGSSPDDEYCACQVFGAFEVMIQGTSTLEQFVRMAVQNVELRANQNAKEPGMQADVKPLETVGELMRRHGVTICNEIASLQHHELEKLYAEEASAYLPETVRRDASDAVVPSCIKRAINTARAFGVAGESKAARIRSIRCSTQDAAMRVVVAMLFNFNDFLVTGVFQQNRVCDDVNLNPMYNQSQGLNVQAWHQSMKTAIGYFSLGVFHLAQNASMMVFPVRPRTRMKCANCQEEFNPLSLATHLRVANCGGCGGHYCSACHLALILAIKNRTKSASVSCQDVDENRDIWHCRSCKTSKSSDKKKGNSSAK